MNPKHPEAHQKSFKKKARRKLLLESIENRILCSATTAVAPEAPVDLAAAGVAVAPATSLSAPADPAPPQSQSVVVADAPATPDTATVAQADAPKAEIAFVDTSLPGYEALLAGMSPDVEVVLLNGSQDGLQQIARSLAGRHGIEAIHLIAHGTEASLTLGSATLTTENMQGQYAPLLQAIGQSLTEGGDVLVYGCNFGKDADGLLASQTLARFTGADVASSTNPTGSTSLGGDWILEAQTGAIEAAVAVSPAAQQLWTGLLAPPPIQFFYVPIPEQAMLASMQAINATVNGTGGMDSIITITATENNTIIYYDQWENGYEANLAVPGQTTGTARTQIWGDGDATNGAPPGAAVGTDPAINSGKIITLRNTIPLPRVAANVFFDGGDMIGASKTISISRAQIPLPTGSVISSAVEVRDTRYFGTNYTAPVGANTARPAGVGTLFSNVFLYVMASQDNTTVQIDADNNGTFEQTVVLNQGQNVVSTTNVLQGGRVVADKPVQTDLFTGNNAASFATRTYSLVPNARLTNDYFTPVGDSGDDVVLFVYNPNAAPITVSFETRTTSGNLPVVAAGGTQFFVVPADTGTRLFTAGGEVFAALGAHDTNGVGSAHDWGFSMQATADLSQFAVVGLGVGNSTNPPSAGGINVSPIWVTPLAATTVYVDNDGDPTTGLFLDPVTGSRYDQSFALAKLQTQRVTDTTGGDQDNSGMRLFTNNGTLISVAWGEDTAAPAGSPGFDAGTTVPALPVPEFYKTVDFAPGGDANADGFYNSGDTLRYTLRIRNIGTQPVSNAAISDALPTALVTYVNSSTFINQGLGAVAISDGGATTFPLDEGGYTIVNLSPGNTTAVTFDVTVNGSLPSGISEVYNTGNLAYQIYNIPAVNSASLRGTVTGTAYVDRNNNGTQDAGDAGIAGVTMTLTGTDFFGAAVSKVVTTDSLGRYTFTDLKESNAAGYTVTQTQPAGYNDGLEARGGTVIPGSGGGPNTITTIVVRPGENDTNNNFGELGGTITGTVFVDANNNGTQQALELGISGVTVTVTGTDAVGDAVNVNVLTDASGNYFFDGLRASNATGYTITETQAVGYLDGLDARQGVVMVGSNATDAISPPIVLATGGSSANNNFGELSPSSLAGFVYNDANNDGTKQGGEAGIAGITITLTGTDDRGAAVSVTTTTAAVTGAYTFANLRPSNGAGYTITEGATAGFLDGTDTIGTPGGTAGNDVFSAVVLASGTSGAGNNFGELSPSSLSGFVYSDLSNFGTKDAFESGIPGVTITLTGTDDRGSAVSLTTTTAAGTGAFAFSNLRPSNAGGYTITESATPPGFTDGLDTIGTQGGTAGNDILSAIVLASGTAGTANNFGESPNFGLTKTLVSTTDAGTSGPNVAVGETATFRLVVTIPAGTFTDFQIQDALPAGYQFVNGSALVSLVSGAGQFTSSTLSGAGLAQTSVGTPTFVMPDAAVSDNSTTNSDGYVSGTDVFFKLGTLTNAETTAAVEQVVIEFQAVVLNEVGNQAGTSLPNTFSVLLDKDGTGAPDPHGSTSTPVTTTVVEPVLGVTKVLTTPGTDAGDAVVYTITITNAAGNNATAYDISVTDLLDTDVVLNNTTLGSGIVVSGAGVTSNTSTTGNLNLVLSSLAAGGTATIALNATVVAGATAGSTVTNATTIAWTSSSGANANERTGGGGINDYTASATSADFILAQPTVDKLTPADTTYSVGETITYDILVTLPEGVTQGLSVTDNLPAGLDFLSAAVQTAAGGVLANPFGGSVSAPAVSNVGNSYTFTFGDTTATNDNDASNNSFLVRVTARVANVAGNQNAVVLTNTATLAYNDGTNGATVVNDPTPNVDISVVEPALTLNKTVVGTSTGLDAGDTVQYQIVITNAGTATANEVTLSDALPVGLLVTAINSTTPAGGAGVDIATGGTGTATLSGEYTIPVGGSVTILYTATLQSSVTPNTNFINTATVTFSSLDGTALGQGTASGERTGSGGLNDYVLTDTAQISTAGALAVAKGVSNSTPTIGDVLTYTVTLTLNEGTTNGIVVTDTLPASGDLQFVPGSAAVSFGTAGSSISGSAAPAISGANGNVLTFTLGTGVIPAGAGANTIVLTYQALVLDVATNDAGDVEGNSASVVATGITSPPPSTTNVTLHEPVLNLSKSAVASGSPGAGDPITYTLTITNPGGANSSTAYDALVQDAMPADVLVTSLSGVVLTGGATTDSVVAITGGGTGLSGQFDIPVGASVTITYIGTVQVTATPGAAETNNAEVTWTTLDGGNSLTPDTGERFGAAGTLFGDASVDNLRRTASQTVTVGVGTFDKQLFATSDANTTGGNVGVGETVTYALVVTLPAGTAPSLSVTDALPAGLQFVSSSIVTSAAASNGLLTADFNGTVPAPAVSGGASDGDDVDFTFGPIVANADGIGGNNTFLILVTARVTDVAGNSGTSGSQTVLGNTATFDIPGDGVPPTTPPPVNVSVVEPRLQITKAASDTTPDAGQTIGYTLTISHTASSTGIAYDVLLRDALPAGITADTASILINGVAVGASPLVDSNSSTGSLLDLKFRQLALGDTITVTYSATVSTNPATAGTTLENNARIFWDTDPAEDANAVLAGGTDGTPDRDFGALTGTEAFNVDTDPAQDTERVTVNSNTISGTVYADADAGGTLNGLESGIQGVTVALNGTDVNGNIISLTTVTGVGGVYTFAGLTAGTYTITETQPGSYVDGIETLGGFGGSKNDALGADAITSVNVPAGASGTGAGYDFGEVLGSSLGGSTFLDTNADGTKQVGEDGLGTAIPVTLTGTDAFGQAVSLSGTSDPVTGAYSFSGLRPSNGAGYTITENDAAVVPSQYFDGAESLGTLAGTVTGAGPKFDAFNVTVAQNQTGSDYNFAEIPPLSLSGNVFADLDNDGSFDAFERGVPGVSVTLSGTDDLGAAVNITVTTGANGAYTFATLRPSNATGYTITETQPTDYADGQDTLGTPGGNASLNDTFSAIVLTATSGANYNFGEQPIFALTKSLVNTSLADTPGSSVSVGEVATFRLVVTVPAGSLTNFQVQDFLPSGYHYVNGSARGGLVSGAGQITSSTLSGAGLALTSVTAPTFVLPDAAVSDNVATNSDTYASGTDVIFKFGNLVNTETTAAVEAIVIEFDAQVLNEAANVAGRTLSNNFGVLYDADGTGDPDPNPTPSTTVDTIVVSPVLTISKGASTAGPVNAGDAITYTLTITNPGGANSSTAFDALVTDTMPADIRVTSITNVVLAGGATTDSAVAITGSGAGLSGQFDIPVGASVTITYIGTVQVTAPTGVAETNNAEVTWTTLNGGNSNTPDTGERFGTAGTLYGDANLNNLRRVDSRTVTVATATFGKQFFDTSDAGTAGSNVAIGEDVTYALVVTVPAGTAPSLSVIDSLPAGLQFVSSSIVTSAAASNGLLTADFNGTVPAPSVSGGASDGDDVSFDFGSIVANADGIAGNNTFLILVTARVTDVVGNIGTSGSQTVLPNTATFDIPGDGVPPTPTPPVDVTVVEPTLAVTKTFSVPGADAGDTVNVTIVVNNTGTGPAYDVTVGDIVDTAKFGSITAVTTPPGFTFNNASGTVSYSGGTIAGGSSATFVFSVKLADAVQPGEILNNTATATATSQPGVVPGERTFGPVSGSATLTAPAVLNVTKGIISPGSTVQLGDIVTYQVNVTVIEGTTLGVVLNDTLPAGMAYVPGSAVVSNANGMTVNGFSATLGGGNVLTISTTSIVNPGSVDSAATDSGTFTITYQATVADVPANTGGTPLTNSITGTGTGVPPTPPSTVTATVTEPQLKVTKAVDDSTPDLGQTVHFTLTIQNLAVANGATAFDILVRDALPTGLGGLTNISVVGANVDTNNSTASLLDLKLDQLALGATVTVDFDAVVGTASAFAGATIENNARIFWDSQAGESPNAVLTGAADGDSDRDYGATGADEVFNLDPQDAQDTERLVVNASALTGVVYGDADASGSLTGGDVALVGETVALTGQTIFGENISITATSGAGGVYSFTNLAPGTYTLTETQPAGYLDGAETVGTTFGGTANAALGSNTISTLTITAGNNSGSGYNFGEVLASSLSGTVYSDANNNGVVNGGEALLDAVPVQLTGTDFLGQAVNISGTTSGGAYSFTNLRPGTYTITETQPAGFLDGQETVGSQGSGTINNLADSNTISAIALTQGVDGSGNNFGELAPGSLSGIVYDDLNNNGGVDSGESGIPGATVVLTGTDDRGVSVNLPLTTQPDGTFTFGNLRPGTYTITETTPAGFLDGKDTAGTLGGSPAVNDVFSGITLNAGGSGTNYRFGELTPSSLSALVFSDLNNNGTQDAGEAGIGGVAVTLTGTDDLNNPVSISLNTLGDGTVAFTNLRPGIYTITETQPGAYLDGKDTAGTLNGSTAVNDVVSAIGIAPAQNGTGYRFGELLPSSLSGNVFIDANNDGIFDGGESAVNGVTVTLTGKDDLGNNVNLTATTVGGAYTFNNLRPSDSAGYTVTETQPAGLLDGKNAVGTASGVTVNNPPSDVISGVVMLNANTVATGYNFGELQPASISGVVFQDFNLDGTENGPDSGILGATVTLTGTDDLGASITSTQTTLANGTYSFGNLRPGTYTVTETQPAGYNDGLDTVGTANGSNAVNDQISAILLGSGTNGTGYTFAEIFPFDPVKSLVSTSNPGTSGSNLSIGEVARYRIIVSLPDGTLPSLVLQDQLPAGLVFLDDGTAAVSLVSQSGNAITSSTLGAGLGGTSTSTAPTFLLPGSAVSSSLTADVDTYGSGADVYFKLGNITNTETNVAGGEYAVIEFNARTENIPANRIGKPLDNTFRVLFDLDNNGTPDVPPVEIVSAPARAVVAEPVLYIDKELTGGSAVPRQNDILTFTVTIGHATGSNATAWEAIFSDTLPKGLDFQGISTSASGGAVITLAATADANGKLSGQFDIPVGGKITITYTVKVNVKPGVDTSLVNGAGVTWTSLPGESTAERHGGDSLYGRGGLNDYGVRDQVTVTPFTFSFDSFNNFGAPARPPGSDLTGQGIDLYRAPLLPLAPIYSGEADPGSTLVITMYNANGENIGTQSVVADAGGNWMVSFPSSTIRDYPNSVQVSQSSAFYSLSDPHGHNMRTYFSPALSAGHFFFEELRQLSEGSAAPLLGDIGLKRPIWLGSVKYGGELLSAIGAPGGY